VLALAWVLWVSLTPASTCLAQAQETTGRHQVWLHENVFPESSSIDDLFNLILYMTGVVGMGVFVVLAIFLVRYRQQPGRRARFTHGNPKLEVAWTLIPTLIMALTAALSQATWVQLKNWPVLAPNEPAVYVNVIAQQFAWNFHYPGKDGKFGRVSSAFRNPAGDIKARIGLDPSDPAGQDDFVTSELVAPVERKVFVKLTSLDVLHSFYLPNFRVKQDAVPGMSVDVWLRSAKTSAEVMGVRPGGGLSVINARTGEETRVSQSKPFDVVCAELCGAGHYTMRGLLYVLPQAEYERYIALNQKSAESAKSEDF
jgi:cytochrome c oxidase subunit 2